MNDLNPVTGCRLDLVIDYVPSKLNGFAVSNRIEPAPVWIDGHIKPTEKAVAGLGKEDQLIQPIDEQVLNVIRTQVNSHPVYRFDLIAIGQNDVKQRFPGRAKEIGEVRSVDPQTKIGRMIERLPLSHR